jgi:hypothetical protein
MLRSSKRLVVVLLLLSVVGCANIPKQPYNKEANRSIQQITLIEPAANPDYSVVNLGHPAQSFGLIGAIIAAGQISAKTNEFSKQVKSRGFDLTAEFKAALTAELEKAGYRVQLLKLPRAKAEFLPKYDGVPAGAHAILDTVIEAGYYCAASNSDYIPTIRSQVRLVKPNGKQLLYQEAVSYGYEQGAKEAISIPAEKKYFFQDFNAISAKVDLALEGMRAGIPLVAKQIADDLKQ